MDIFYLVTNDGKDIGLRITKRIKGMLEDAGKTCVLCRKDNQNRILCSSVPKEVDCVVVVGGDGTLIEAARILYGREIPILGVNMGTLGYLTEVETGQIEEAVEQMLKGDFTLERRMMLKGTFGDGKEDTALNDIVVTRKGFLRVIHFNIYVNGELLNSYEADGIIISTPTGSTAYNFSAGGPVVEPTASMFVITPICSHALNMGSIVLSCEDEIVVEVGQGKNHSREEVYMAFDGADMFPLYTGDSVRIRRADFGTQLVKLSKISFLEILRRKMKGK